MSSENRIPLRDRPFPDYTRSEEMLNMASHLFGVLCAAVMMWLTVRATVGDPFAMMCGVVYVSSVALMFLMSAIYHGLPRSLPKQVMRVVDHCDIFITIAGTYTPITLLGICQVNPALGWSIFAAEWVLALVGIVLNAIDLKKYARFSMACYLGMGWFIIVGLRATVQAMTWAGFLYILGGGVAYTIGAALYLVGKRRNKRYRHSLFHLFVVAGALFQFYGILEYVL